MGDRFNKEMSRIGRFSKKIEDTIEAPIWTITAASIPQDELIASFYTILRVNLCLDLLQVIGFYILRIDIFVCGKSRDIR